MKDQTFLKKLLFVVIKSENLATEYGVLVILIRQNPNFKLGFLKEILFCSRSWIKKGFRAWIWWQRRRVFWGRPRQLCQERQHRHQGRWFGQKHHSVHHRWQIFWEVNQLKLFELANHLKVFYLANYLKLFGEVNHFKLIELVN